MDKRDRAETCADCADQSCTTCQSRLRAARTYDQLAVQMLQAGEAPPATYAARPSCTPRSASPHSQPTRRPGSDLAPDNPAPCTIGQNGR